MRKIVSKPSVLLTVTCLHHGYVQQFVILWKSSRNNFIWHSRGNLNMFYLLSLHGYSKDDPFHLCFFFIHYSDAHLHWKTSLWFMDISLQLWLTYPSKFALVQVKIFSLLFLSLRYFSQFSQPSYSNCSRVYKGNNCINSTN